MAARTLLLAAYLLLSIAASGVLMTNPDSEIVQDESSDAQDVQKKSIRMLNVEDDTRKSGTSAGSQKRNHPISYTKVIKPIETGGMVTQEVLHKVLPHGMMIVSRITVGRRYSRPDLALPPDDKSTDGRPTNSAGVNGQSNPNEHEAPLDESTNNNNNFNVGRSGYFNGFVATSYRGNQNNEQSFSARRQANDESSIRDPYPNRSSPGQSPRITLDANPAVTNFNSNPGRGGGYGGYSAPSPTSNRDNEPVLPNSPDINRDASSGNFNSNPGRGGGYGGYSAPGPTSNRDNEPVLPNSPDINRDASSGNNNWGSPPSNNRPNESDRPIALPVAQPPPRNFGSSGNFNTQFRRNGTQNAGGYPPAQDNSQNPQYGNVNTHRGQGGSSTSPAAKPGTRGGNTNKRISPDSNLFAGIVNDFTFKLIDTLNLDSNFVVSPLSVFIALSMCYLGSAGSTKAQLESVLGLNQIGVHGDKLHQGIKDLMSVVLPQSSAEYQLLLANGMFLGNDYSVNRQFAATLQTLYTADVNYLDFKKPELSATVINDWVTRATNGMITSMSDQPPSAKTTLMLLNAIFFKGIWKTQFPPDMTYNGRFYASDGSDRTVPTMPLYGEKFHYYRSEDHRQSFIKLPYQGDQISMIIALPYTLREKPMSAITDQLLCHIRDAMVETTMDTVTVPKFKFERTMSLKEPLTRLGITDLFNPNAVDLRGLRMENDVVVEGIVHKAVVEVNEQGTTAAATTGVRFVPLSLRNTTDFVANHPFAFYIVHEPSGLVLFYGKVFDLGERKEPTSNSSNNNNRDGAAPAAPSNGGYNRRDGAAPASPPNSNNRRPGGGSSYRG